MLKTKHYSPRFDPRTFRQKRSKASRRLKHAQRMSKDARNRLRKSYSM